VDVEDVLAELVSRERRYPPGLIQANSEPLFTEADLQSWATSTGLDKPGLLDALALALAHDYDEGELSYSQCDLIVNFLHSSAYWSHFALPDVFFAVYLAFDAGEYYHDNDRTKDPEREYTRPQISELLRKAEGR
jgi:hypothetical protein